MAASSRRLPDQRVGTPLEIDRQKIRFSVWPTRERDGSYLPQAELFTKNPWEAIENAVNSSLDRRSKRLDICLSFLYQARDFYIAYDTARIASRPLLLYYAFLNLAKTLILFRDVPSDLDNAVHGVSENRTDYRNATITVKQVGRQRREIFDLFSQALGNPALTRDLTFRLTTILLPQIVIGHRLWAQATNSGERFVRAERIRYVHGKNSKAVWALIDIKKSDLTELNLSVPNFIRYSSLTEFNQVKAEAIEEEGESYLNNIIRLEQQNPIIYASEAGEALHQLPGIFKRRLWCIMRTVPEYRRYYFWASSRIASNDLMDPLLSVYLVVFYLGSVTRYRPDYFEDLQASPFGNLFDEIIQTQGQQMLFHLAAEFQKREVSWPAVL
jgi:hypothetical protein